jgi:transcriptional regulator with XRE-family HTH domain
MTQKEAAEALAVSESTYRRYEKNPWSMPAGVLDRFSRATGIPIEQFKITHTGNEIGEDSAQGTA